MKRVFANNLLLNSFYEWQDKGGLQLSEEDRKIMPMWLLEAEGAVDFPVYLASKIQRVVHENLKAMPAAAWRYYTKVVPFTDFRANQVLGFAGIGDLLEIRDGQPYVETTFDETDYGTMTLGTYGRIFAITRHMVVNDDLGKIMEIPTLMARAAMRTIAKKCAAVLIANPTLTLDSVAMFDATHGNLGSTALSEATLAAGRTAIAKQTDLDGEIIGFVAKNLIIPIDLEQTAERILNSNLIPAPGTGLGGANVLQNKVQPITEPYLSDTNDWYLFADPNDAPAIKVGFLNGKDTPDVLLEDSNARFLSGAQDPYSFSWDTIRFKVRIDFVVKAIDWRGTYKAVV